MRALFGKRRSDLNPNFCNLCDEASRRFPGGSEVEMSMLFADVRGSTALSEQMSPTEFSRLINRFYTQATKVIAEEDGLVEKLAGDSVAAFWGAGSRAALTLYGRLSRAELCGDGAAGDPDRYWRAHGRRVPSAQWGPPMADQYLGYRRRGQHGSAVLTGGSR